MLKWSVVTVDRFGTHKFSRMDNPWLQHLLLLAGIHTAFLGVAKLVASWPSQRLQRAAGLLEGGSYLVNGAFITVIADAWIQGRNSAAGVAFGDLVFPPWSVRSFSSRPIS